MGTLVSIHQVGEARALMQGKRWGDARIILSDQMTVLTTTEERRNHQDNFFYLSTVSNSLSPNLNCL